MDITYYKLKNDTIGQVDQGIDPQDWEKETDWIDIRETDRKEFTEYFDKLDLNTGNIRDSIEHPAEFPFVNTFENIILLNLPVSNAADIYKTDYITLIYINKLIITITPQDNDLFNEWNLSIYSPKIYPSLGNFIFHVLAMKILAKSNTNMSLARNRLKRIESMLSNDPEDLSSKGLMSCERDISQLSDIIEDQYLGFEILASLSTSYHTQEDLRQNNKLVKGFEPLDKAMARLEKKAESLRLQYMLFQQEKSTRKINLLTIIQAIFVPLTFVAGVYGMNFINMPELNWKFGYLLVWLVFFVLAGGSLVYFYRKGWFD